MFIVNNRRGGGKLASLRTVSSLAMAAGAAALMAPSTAHAVPSYARQTGLACEACHTVFPQLTPFGRRFKLNGYTLTTGPGVSDVNEQKQSTLSLADLPPISAMIEATDTFWNGAPADKAGQGKIQNGDVLFPRQLSLFYAGRIADHLGAYAQITYEGAGDHLSIDNTDIRYSDHTSNNQWVWGVSLNNNPGVQDVWENNPGGWAFPFIKAAQYSGARFWAGSAQPMIMGLGQASGGVGAYVFYNDSVYLEASVYKTVMPGSNAVDAAEASANGAIQNGAPYWRAAYEKDIGDNSFQVGTTGMFMKVENFIGQGLGFSQGAANSYTDLGLDAQYQHITGNHIFELTGNYWHESQDINAANIGTANSNGHDSLDWVEVVGSYWYQRKFGGSIGFVNQSGSRDALAYTGGGAGGMASLNGSPNTQFETLEVDYMPWLNTKFMVQYNIYNEVMGGSSFTDMNTGLRRSASDNNTLMIGMWTAF